MTMTPQTFNECLQEAKGKTVRINLRNGSSYFLKIEHILEDCIVCIGGLDLKSNKQNKRIIIKISEISELYPEVVNFG